jgi:endoglucanase
MKSTKKVMLSVMGAALSLALLASCKSKLPDTSSKIVTQPQPFDSSITALELSKKMGNGINLSNTLEAFGAEELCLGKDPKEYETFWGQPVTTPELMKLYKESGFDTIRIPVAWTNAMDWKNKNYVIGTDYIDRVEEVVNYALDAGLYVIFNDHWDGDWWGMFGSASEATRAEAWKMYEAMWTQLAVRFKNYSEKVIFELER